MTWEPCACGGVILVNEDQSPARAVQAHQQELRHLLWYIANLERELAFTVRRDLTNERPASRTPLHRP